MLPKPVRYLSHLVVYPPPRSFSYPFQSPWHPLRYRFAAQSEPSLPRLPAIMREPKKVERLRRLSPRSFRFSAAWRPNSMRRVLSGCRFNPNSDNLSFMSPRNCSASSFTLKTHDAIVRNCGRLCATKVRGEFTRGLSRCHACTEDEGGPLGAVVQAEGSKPPMAAVFKRRGGERVRKRPGENRSGKDRGVERE